MHYLEERRLVMQTAMEISTSGMVTGTWGNVSTRAGEDQMVITPSGMDYNTMSIEDMVVLNLENAVVEGIYRPSIETPLHTAVYKNRPDVQAIVHVHSIYAAAFAVAGRSIPVVLEESAQALGGEVPVADYARCGTMDLAESVVKALGTDRTAVLMANHGLIGVGKDMKAALRVCHIAEKTARVSIYALLLGSCNSLSPADVQVLNHKFKGYGQNK